MCEQRKRAVKILRISADIILGAVLLALITLTVYIMTCNMRGEVAEVFGVSVVRVVTGSMEPSIREGDYILVRKTDTSELMEGDIICFYSEEAEIKGKLNTHRIMNVTESGFITKGDANKYPDEAAVSPGSVIGKYEGKIGFLRWISSFASAEKLIFMAVVLLLTFVAVFEVRTIAKVTKEQ
ncbi:MAG: signal peptidase I, partial [Ruminiclostridium sp.]